MSERTVHVSVFGKTDLGRTRDHNEDTFIVADLSADRANLLPEVRQHDVGERGSLFMVADGMGGAAAGELASAMAADLIHSHMATEWMGDSQVTIQRFAHHLRESVDIANHRIHNYALQRPELRGMGTTATVAGVIGSTLVLAQVGDSRAYLIRQGEAVQITKDQSLTQRLVDAGELTEEEAEKSERRNIILQALGPEPQVAVDLTREDLRQGDTLVLCSDGLSGNVKAEEIAEVVTASGSPSDACQQLIELANDRGGPDNITVVVIEFSGSGLRRPGDDSEPGYHIYDPDDSRDSSEEVVEQAEPAQVSEQTRYVVPAMIVGLILAIIAFYIAFSR